MPASTVWILLGLALVFLFLCYRGTTFHHPAAQNPGGGPEAMG